MHVESGPTVRGVKLLHQYSTPVTVTSTFASSSITGRSSLSGVEGRLLGGKHELTGKMIAPRARVLATSAVLCLAIFVRSAAGGATAAEPPRGQDDLKKIELFDGVSVNIPNEANSTEKLLSFEIDTERSLESGRGSKSKKLLQRILPMFIMPFLIQSAIVPLFLGMLKFMLFKSAMIGKLALALILLNAFKNQNKGRDAEFADKHYGYSDTGMEYGAYVN
ncbi:hypothetical protein NE865_08575 [Phthorimaea operculella]|nr:hypothetical protein NE865_08575 [Phthorimaea operculella]